MKVEDFGFGIVIFFFFFWGGGFGQFRAALIPQRFILLLQQTRDGTASAVTLLLLSLYSVVTFVAVKGLGELWGFGVCRG